MTLRGSPGAEGRRRLEIVERRQQELADEFASHPVFAWLCGEPAAERVRALLVQRRFLSLGFTPLYDLALDALEDESTKAVLRAILREEYATGMPTTHREDLLLDLCAVGADKQEVLAVPISPTTMESLSALLSLMRRTQDAALHRIQVLAAIWCAGEVLVADEYSRLWPVLERLGLARDSAQARVTGSRVSVFYYPHMSHDGPRGSLTDRGTPLARRGHADDVADCLREALLTGPAEGVAHCCLALEASTRAKRRFYDQFP